MKKTAKKTEEKPAAGAASEEKKRALETALSQINKTYGKGAIMRLGENTAMNVSAISTGSLSLDIALGVGGVPRGRIVEIYGPESSGKTTVALHIMAEAQKAGGTAAFIDAEHALDPVYAKALGVDIDELLISQPDSGEQALEIAEALIRSGAIDALVIDSVAALIPQKEIDGEMGDAMVGTHARLMSQAMRKLNTCIAKSNCVVIFINQIRMKIGVMYGNPETTTGGNALKFYSSVRIEIRKADNLKVGGETYGARARCKIVKNKVAPPFKIAEFDILFGKGINKIGEIVDLGVATEVLEKSGSWFSYGEDRLAQGRENLCAFLAGKPDLCAELEAKIKEAAAKAEDEETPSGTLTEVPFGAGASAGEEDESFNINIIKVKEDN